jgi:hypothetical protein
MSHRSDGRDKVFYKIDPQRHFRNTTQFQKLTIHLESNVVGFFARKRKSRFTPMRRFDRSQAEFECSKLDSIFPIS